MAFKMKGHTLPGINQKMDKSSKPDGRAKSSVFQKNEKDKVKDEKDKVRQEATGPEGGGGVFIKNKAMVNLEENKPAVDSPGFAAWNVAYQKAVKRNKADNAPK
jgi:hypothetical protein